ncbi:MAG: hypothetical protein R2883_03185 [Caldisericia bacterium]
MSNLTKPLKVEQTSDITISVDPPPKSWTLRSLVTIESGFQMKKSMSWSEKMSV